jgi:transcriptional regulator with XRE-family HTH domain
MGPSYNKVFGIVLKELRLTRGLTQAELASRSDLERSYISLLERGMRSPSLDSLMTLCHGLRVPFSYLAQRIEEEMASSTRRR